jgi:hypothetical protein
MTDQKPDYSAKNVITLLVGFISYASSYGLIYLRLTEDYERQFGALERVILEQSSSKFSNIIDLASKTLGLYDLIWTVCCASFLAEFFKYIIKWQLFNDDPMQRSFYVDLPELKIALMEDPNTDGWGNYLLKPSDQGYSEEVKAKSRSVYWKNLGLVGCRIAFMFTSVYALFGVLGANPPFS